MIGGSILRNRAPTIAPAATAAIRGQRSIRPVIGPGGDAGLRSGCLVPHRRGTRFAPQRELVPVRVDDHRLALADLSRQQPERERVLHLRWISRLSGRAPNAAS